jgi:hypothetical protein
MPPIPWEDRRDLGLARAFGRTLVLAARYPSYLYPRCRQPASPLAAIVFGLSFELLVASLEFLHEKIVGQEELQATLERYGPELRQVLPGGADLVETVLRGSALASFLFTPVSYLIELLATTAVTWIGLRLIRKLRTPFTVLLRAFAYASWVRIFGLLGATGDIILGAIGFLLSFGFGSWAWLAAVKETQQIDTTSAVYASLAGGFVAFALACIVGLPIIVLLGMWAAANVHLPSLTQ